MYKRFEELLKKTGETPYRVAKDTGVSQVTLTDWKQGRTTPKLFTLKKIADHFGVTVDYFLSEK